MTVLKKPLLKLESREQANAELRETWIEMRKMMATIQALVGSGQPGLENCCRIVEHLTKRLRHNTMRLRSTCERKSGG